MSIRAVLPLLLALAGLLGACSGRAQPIANEARTPTSAPHAEDPDAVRHLDVLDERITTYFQEKGELPPSSNLLPAGDACASPTKTIAPAPEAEWFADAGWAALRFRVAAESRFQYRWMRRSETSGLAEAIGDLDCDGTASTYRLDVTVIDGNLVRDRAAPSPD